MTFRTAVETAEAVARGEVTATQVLDETLARIDRHNPTLNAFVQIDRDAAKAAAAEVDRRVARGEAVGPLAGVPVGVKDFEACRGFRTTQGSWFLRDSPISSEDSRHVARLRAAGAVIVGMTATAEFGMDSACTTRLWGVTRNPWNLERTPGGSSGGSSAAVAAGLVPLATGTDAGGSIRQPAAYTGLVGLKASHGRIPKQDGFSNFGVSGALTRTVADCARHLDVACGPHPGDRTSLPRPHQSFESSLELLDVRGLRAHWSGDLGYAVVEPEVEAIARRAAEQLMQAAGLVPVECPFHPVNVYNDVAVVLLSNLEAQWTREGLLPDGYPMLSPSVQHIVDLLRSNRDRVDADASWARIRQLEQQLAGFFEGCDLLMTPATACRPHGADERIPSVIDGRDASSTGAEPFGALVNACWVPAISIPAGLTADGLPVGLQIVARHHREDILLRLARIAEQTMPWPCPPNYTD
ncbi:amidase [Rubrivivax albus]|uniref:Amidase n=1 Tax=Rubrivivax albus TaxID=2499835 RepID=A0A3S2UPR9_9BURK|nr:amidase [Rubrivivax albus]RVT51293.1 amidase [Rubrivivax albus]